MDRKFPDMKANCEQQFTNFNQVILSCGNTRYVQLDLRSFKQEKLSIIVKKQLIRVF